MLTQSRQRPGLRRRFLRDSSGATAVEFAMVAAPLLFMLFAVFELALVFAVSTSLEAATSTTARALRTGVVRTATKESFRNSVCDEIGWLGDQCRANLSIDVRVYENFKDLEDQEKVDPVVVKNVGGKEQRHFDEDLLIYENGGPGDIILVRAFYRWTLISPFLSGGLERLDNGVTLVTAATTFRNEPYPEANPADD